MRVMMVLSALEGIQIARNIPDAGPQERSGYIEMRADARAPVYRIGETVQNDF